MKFSSLVRTLLGVVVWSAALYGALQINRLRGQWGHGICGPWGCGPPLQALLACHAFWVVLLAPPTALTAALAPARTVGRWGIILSAVGTAGLIGVAVWQALAWLPATAGWRESFFLQRYLFVLATLVDVPVVPLTVREPTTFTIGWRRRCSARVNELPANVAASKNVTELVRIPSVGAGQSELSRVPLRVDFLRALGWWAAPTPRSPNVSFLAARGLASSDVFFGFALLRRLEHLFKFGGRLITAPLGQQLPLRQNGRVQDGSK